MTDPIDKMAPWTIKSVATATREDVIAAARQEGLTVGQWLERKVREWKEAGGSVRVSDQGRPTVMELAQMAAALSAGRETKVVRAARAAVLALLMPHVPAGLPKLETEDDASRAAKVSLDRKPRLTGPRS